MIQFRARGLLALLLFAAPCLAEIIPLTHGTTLSGKEVVLPRDLPSRISILVLGFTQKSAESSRGWGIGLAPLIAANKSVTCFQIPVLASVPRLFRGVVLRLMRNGVPGSIQPFFLPIFEGEKEWKKTVSYREPDESYVLLVGRTGEIVWQTHGAFTEQKLRELTAEIAKAGLR